jgi:hypothetical protein
MASLGARRAIAIMAASITLAACDAPRGPLVKRANTTPEQEAADMAACKAAPKPAFTLGNPLAMCMQAKGYDTWFRM